MRRFRFLLPALLLTLSLAACGGGSGGGDEEDPDSSAGDTVFCPELSSMAPLGIGPVDCAQSFVVGTTGIFQRVEMTIDDAEGAGTGSVLRFELRTVTGGAIDEDPGGLLGAVNRQRTGLPSTPGLVSVSFESQMIEVTSGQALAIVLLEPTNGDTVARVYGVTPGIFAGGTGYRRSGGGSFAPTSTDFCIITYVAPAP